MNSKADNVKKQEAVEKQKNRDRDLWLHVRGESVFIDDINAPRGTLFASVFASPVAHGRIRSLDTEKAKAVSGVVAVFTAEDIPGENQIGTIIQDEELLASEEVHHIGQPVALVLGETRQAARLGRQKIKADIESLTPVLDPREAYEKGEILQKPRTFALGDVDKAWNDCAHIISGRVESGAQEHFYLETQSSLAIPRENRTLRICSATQSPTGVQSIAARVLGLPMHAVEVETRRLGGAFGGKEEQATPWAVLAGLGALATGRAVRLNLNRRDDIQWTGKRHPYSSDFSIGLDKEGRILAYEVFFYQNAGSAADLSTSILERTLLHAGNSYSILNVRATAVSCRTNLPPFTAFRGFGGPQGMFVLEAAIDRAAREMQLPARTIQKRNLLNEGDLLPYGMRVTDCRARECWEKAEELYAIEAAYARVEAFNAENRIVKKGLALMPVCFGISFTNIGLNQARSLVHVYNDGSVHVSTGAVEMGQGVNRKIEIVAAQSLGLSRDYITLDTTNTARVANTSPTAASTGSDLNGKATELACQQILHRLRRVAAPLVGHNNPEDISIGEGRVLCCGEDSGLSWEDLVNSAYWQRTSLSAVGHYATPGIHFDKSREDGVPFAYHVYGTALTEVSVDTLRGTFTLDSVELVHDLGRSLDLLTDRGQVEGALAQGIGWMTLEELSFNDEGRLLQDAASKYKIPDIRFMPEKLHVHFIEKPNPRAVFNSKAVGEPPFMYGIGTYFALRAALRAAGAEKGAFGEEYRAPLGPEQILMALDGGGPGINLM